MKIVIDYGLTDTVAVCFDAGIRAGEQVAKDLITVRVRVEGQLTFNGTAAMLDAALAGFGLAYVPEDDALDHIDAGRLVRVLEDWCPPYPGYHLYYPSRRQLTPAFTLLVNTLRRR